MSDAFSAWGAMLAMWRFVRGLAVAGIYVAVGVFVAMDQWLYSFDKYFYVGEVTVPRAVAPDGFRMDVTSHPKRSFQGSYKVILRSAVTGQVEAEYPDSGVFPYNPKYDGNGEQLPGYADPVGFDWWVGLEGRLPPLPEGLHYAQTCWTVHSRPFPLLNVSSCVDSNHFRVE